MWFCCKGGDVCPPVFGEMDGWFGRGDMSEHAERASPFPTRTKRQCEHESERATNGRPYGTLLIGLTRNTRAGHAPPLQKLHQPKGNTDKKAEGTVLPSAAFVAISSKKSSPAPLARNRGAGDHPLPTRKPEPVVWVPAALDSISISKS